MNMAILIMVPMVAAATLNFARTLMVDPDLWWHLADARFLVTSHHFIRADHFSFTSLGQYYIDWEWLSNWCTGSAIKRCLQGIYAVTWMALAANILFVYWRGYWMAAVPMQPCGLRHCLCFDDREFGPRMIEFGYFAMSGN